MTKCQFNMSESMLNIDCARGVNTTDYIFFQAWKAEKRRRLSEHQYKYVNKLKDFKQVDPTKVNYLLGNALYDKIPFPFHYSKKLKHIVCKRLRCQTV